MTLRAPILRLLAQEDLNFLLTNRIPRRLATQFIGWFSQIEQPLVRDLSIGMWRFFSDLDLSEAKKSRFRSTLAGCTATIHEHLDGRVSLRYGPHVVGRFDRLKDQKTGDFLAPSIVKYVTDRLESESRQEGRPQHVLSFGERDLEYVLLSKAK